MKKTIMAFLSFCCTLAIVLSFPYTSLAANYWENTKCKNYPSLCQQSGYFGVDTSLNTDRFYVRGNGLRAKLYIRSDVTGNPSQSSFRLELRKVSNNRVVWRTNINNHYAGRDLPIGYLDGNTQFYLHFTKPSDGSQVHGYVELYEIE